MGKENIGSLQSTRCNEPWDRIKDELNKIGVTKNLLQRKNKMKNLKEAKSRIEAQAKKWFSSVYVSF